MIDRQKLTSILEDIDGLVDEAQDTLTEYANARHRDQRATAARVLDEFNEHAVGILVAAAKLVEEATLNR